MNQSGLTPKINISKVNFTLFGHFLEAFHTSLFIINLRFNGNHPF